MISYRPILALIAAVAAIFVSVRLAYSVEFVGGQNGRMNLPPDEQRAESRSVVQDKLIDIVYSKENRKENLAAFGLPSPLIKQVEWRIVNYERNYIDCIDMMIDDAPDTDQVHHAFCGRTSSARPRYEALRFLVDEDSGRRAAIDIDRADALNYFEWADRARIPGVFKSVELIQDDNRKDDATLMGVAAILLEEEDRAIEGDAPWGRGSHKWDWNEVIRLHTVAEERVVAYFALFHIFAERMHREGGLCSGG
jgi:hypothetical protein